MDFDRVHCTVPKGAPREGLVGFLRVPGLGFGSQVTPEG